MIQESETQRNTRTCAGEEEEGGSRAGWSSDENGARVHRFKGWKGVDKGMGDRQVRVAEQIYWIQGGCKSGRISVTKERCAYWRTRESGLKSEGRRERRIEGGGHTMEGHVKHGDRR